MIPVEPTDDSLVARVKAGEAEAFAILAERHRAGLVRLASLLIGDLDEAESIAQEAITRALAGIASYDPQTPRGLAAPANGSRLLSTTKQGPRTFFEPYWARDFITMSAR